MLNEEGTSMVFLIALMFLLPLFYMLVGHLLKKHHSKFPDTSCGYHIGRLAQKSESTWETANTYSGTVLTRSSMVTLGISILVIVIYNFSTSFIRWDDVFFAYIMGISFIPIIILTILTEKHLKISMIAMAI